MITNIPHGNQCRQKIALFMNTLKIARVNFKLRTCKRFITNIGILNEQ